MSAAEDEFLLKWHDHHQSFFMLVEELVMREQLTDVTLACGGSCEADQQLLSAHSLMLSVCSPYFRSLLSENRHKEKHHIIHLHGVSSRHMQQLLLYMYRGEISISQEDLGPLIETAKCLQIKGLAMAQTNMASPTPGKRRAVSQSPETTPTSSSSNSSTLLTNRNKKTKTKHRSNSPITDETVVPSQDFSTESIKGEIPEEININIGENKPELVPEIPETIFGHKGIGLLNTTSSPVNLPLLPKPLSILKTAETRTYLSKLIWLGNGGRRPQYGNPDTKPSWWPQHILPWEEMKKMGGRKSVELSHINYTEILKQCLAAGYEYFGYDPATYYSTETSGHPQECSYVIDDGNTAAGDEESVTDAHDLPLEIDLDHVTKDDKSTCKTVRRGSDQKQILCK